MTNEEAIATLKANYPDACYEQLREAVDTAISALGKAPTALDHIHNVVAEREYQRGYKQAKEEYDHKLTEIKSRFKDHYYNKGYSEGYERGKADANYPEFPDSCNAETVEAIPVPWIESYALLAEADGRPFFAEGIRDMVEEWKRDRKVD